MIVKTSQATLAAGGRVEVAYGDILRVTVMFDVIMPAARSVELWVSLIIEPGRDYTIKHQVPVNASLTPVTYKVIVDMPISQGIGLKNMTYDLWAELPAYNIVDKIPNAVTITGIPENFTLIRDNKYPLYSTYKGYAEKSTMTWSVVTPSFMIDDAKVNSMIEEMENKVAEEGVHMLQFTLYESSGPVKSDYIAYITTTVPGTIGSTAAVGSPITPTVFGIDDAVLIAILIAVCLIVGLIIILVVRGDVSQFLFGSDTTPGLMDMIGMVVVVMMMTMMMENVMPMFEPAGTPAKPKPVTEAAVKGAKAVGKGAVTVVKKAAPVVGKAVKTVTEKMAKRGEEEYEEEEDIF